MSYRVYIMSKNSRFELFVNYDLGKHLSDEMIRQGAYKDINGIERSHIIDIVSFLRAYIKDIEEWNKSYVERRQEFLQMETNEPDDDFISEHIENVYYFENLFRNDMSYDIYKAWKTYSMSISFEPVRLINWIAENVDGFNCRYILIRLLSGKLPEVKVKIWTEKINKSIKGKLIYSETE